MRNSKPRGFGNKKKGKGSGHGRRSLRYQNAVDSAPPAENAADAIEPEPARTEPDVIYGRWPVREALAAGPVAKVFIARGTSGGPVDEIVALAKQKKVPYHFIDRDQINRIAG